MKKICQISVLSGVTTAPHVWYCNLQILPLIEESKNAVKTTWIFSNSGSICLLLVPALMNSVLSVYLPKWNCEYVVGEAVVIHPPMSVNRHIRECE